MSDALSDAAAELLPAPGDAMRCADHARALAIDPGGSAIDADAVVLVDLPPPWPKPVFEHELFTGLASTMPIAAGRSRVLATVPRRTDREFGATVFWREGESTRRARIEGDPPSCIDQLIDEMPIGEPAGLAALICTQGSHDVCCGTEGTRLAMELSESLPELDLHRVSHTGGHRFAPTLMTMPDGRMWARADSELVARVFGRVGRTGDVVPRCRGSWSAASGPAQVAERAVFGAVGWDWDDRARTVEAVDDNTFVVSDGSSTWMVTVAVEREVPTIACRTAGGLPAKLAVEYRVDDLRVV